MTGARAAEPRPVAIERLPGGFHLQLLNGFRLLRTDRPFAEAVRLSDSAERLLAFLALRRVPVARQLVAGLLWPERPEIGASANLRSTILRLRRCASGVLDVDDRVLALNASVTVDLHHRAEALSDRPPSLIEDVLFADLLPGWYEDWVLHERDRHLQRQLHVADALVERAARVGDLAHAIDLAIRLVARDPLRERSQLALISALALEGSFGLARDHYRRYSALLEHEFGWSTAVGFDEACRYLSVPDAGAAHRAS